MPARTDTFDLGSLNLVAGEGRRLTLDVRLDAFRFGGQRYEVEPERETVAVTVDTSRMTGGGYALRLRLTAAVTGPCMRCLEPATPQIGVDAREVDRPGGGDELSSPYVDDSVLDLAGWARDALALAMPAQIVCHPECAGLCPICGVRLDDAGPAHGHDAEPDPRWAKLLELKLE
jgi:DUF177 domain-containing protein